MTKKPAVYTTSATPGPWTYDAVWSLIKGPNGEEVAALHSGAADGERQSPGIVALNAALIAAAPEMLEALRALAHIASYYHKGEAPGHLDACENPDNCGHCLAMRATNAAIAKAEGRDA